MTAMRRFTCYDCNKDFEVAYGVGGSGREMKCPECGGTNIHRAEGDRGFERSAGRAGAGGGGRGPSSEGRGRGGQGRGPRWA